jgi:uncharacterized protein YcfJ
MSVTFGFMYQNPMDGELRRLEAEQRLRQSGKGDPERPPTPERGDAFIAIGLILGFIVGGIIGWLFGLLIAIVIGAIAGAVLGTVAGNALKKRAGKKREIEFHDSQ